MEQTDYFLGDVSPQRLHTIETNHIGRLVLFCQNGNAWFIGDVLAGAAAWLNEYIGICADEIEDCEDEGEDEWAEVWHERQEEAEGLRLAIGKILNDLHNTEVKDAGKV